MNLASWCEAYVAAGLPPERFWTLSPRLFATELAGAEARLRRERGLAWDNAMLVRTEKPPSFEQYVGGGAVRKEPAAFLDMRLRASVRGLRTVTMAEYRKARARQ